MLVSQVTLSCRCVFLLFIITSVLQSVRLAVTWRYSSLQGDGASLTTRNVLKLEAVLDPSSSVPDIQLTWTANTCKLTSRKGKTVYMKCSEPGIHRVTLDAMSLGSKTRDLKFRTTFMCYDWYLTVDHVEREEVMSETAANSNLEDKGTASDRHVLPSGVKTAEVKTVYQKLRIWIVDKLQTTEQERDGTASLPSKQSSRLTKQFYLLGQHPVVTYTSAQTDATEVITASVLGFNETYSFWEIVSKDTTYRQPIYTVTGQSVALYECLISDLESLHPHSKFTNIQQTEVKYFLVGSESQSLVLIPDACQANVAVFILQGKVYLTQDDFKTFMPLPAPEELAADLNITSIALMFNYLAVLDVNGNVYTLHLTDSIFNEYKLPVGFTPTAISSQDWCIDGLSSPQDLDLLAFYNPREVWLSNHLQPAYKLELPEAQIRQIAKGLPYSFEVHDVALDVQPGRLGLALKLSVGGENKVIFATVNIKTRQWEVSHFWVDFKNLNAGKITMFFLGLAKPSFFFRNQKSLFYSYDGAELYGMKGMYGCSNATTLVSDPNYIRDIIISRNGDISVLLSTNQIYYGKVKNIELILLDEFYPAGMTNVIHWFDRLNRLWFISVQNDGNLTKVQYPVSEELYTVIGDDANCPFKHFLHNIKSQVYKLDMGETRTVWIMLVYYASSYNYLNLLHNNPHDVITLNKTSQYKSVNDVASQNMTITVHQSKDFTNVTDYVASKSESFGVSILEVRPSRSSLTCNTRDHASMYVSVGCPPGRHIKVQSDASQECSKDVKLPHEYRIKAGGHINLVTGEVVYTEKIVHMFGYDVDCVVELSGSGVFKPQLNLYDGDDVFIRHVEANFIVQEVFGRRDFTYSHHMEGVGCLQEAQTWQEMRRMGNYSLKTEEIWGAYNYRSCFESDGNLYMPEALHSLKYEILNRSGLNQLVFNLQEDAIYVFRVYIIDPNFSFCNLSTNFGVKIKGPVKEEDLGAIAAANYAVLACILAALTGTYVWFHKKTVKKVNPKEQQTSLRSSQADVITITKKLH